MILAGTTIITCILTSACMNTNRIQKDNHHSMLRCRLLIESCLFFISSRFFRLIENNGNQPVTVSVKGPS